MLEQWKSVVAIELAIDNSMDILSIKPSAEGSK